LPRGKKDRGAGVSALTPALLRRWPLPAPDEGGDKESRGRVLIVGGAVVMPGAIVLAATGALRAGAGKLRIATCRSIAPAVGVAVPEALVAGVPETKNGGIAPRCAGYVAEQGRGTAALLVGPGMVDGPAVSALLADLLPRIDGEATVVLDAEALGALAKDSAPLRAVAGRAILTPHAGEMATLLGVEKAEVDGDALACATRAARETGAVIALKGATTYVVGPDGTAYRYDRGKVGLATSGSGDTLAGIIAGLAARGAPPVQAAAWGVVLHGEAGNALTTRVGAIGFLARELLDQVPRLMGKYEGRGTR
jgi:hydroxyethylthiazole kinase-like uncharacterized protein yjeF